ncbi:MAG: UvrD-helicase domain-containing protein [Synergistaceae bacterium]|jgi:ATP-dependent exoDNAse (exonuclease V) beta subunit|nr:UvrD-helicase domain-containing protein [Synergistaceae bacterium]
MFSGELERLLLPLIEGEREEQRLAIRSRRGLTVVSAGAGTGKTHTLARRFAWLLATDPDCRVDEILTLTFTQLAANEMRERIKATLRTWYDYDRKNLGHLRDAIERVDEAYISTIHSFALRVIRESGLDLDIDPGSSLIGDAAESEFWDDYSWNLATLAADRVAASLPNEWRGRVYDFFRSPGCVPFLNYFGPHTIAMLAKEAGEVFGSKNEHPDDLFSFPAAREEQVESWIASALSPDVRELWDLWRDVVFPAIGEHLDGAKDAFSGRIRELRDKWGAASHDERDDESERAFAVELIGRALSPLPGKSKLKERIEDEIGEKLTDWRKRYERVADISGALFRSPPYSVEEAQARRLLLASAAIGWKIWDAYRLRAGGLSFSDLVRYAERILRDGDYGLRFKHVMIDEFQDTDGLQDAMISSLASGETKKDGRTLFVVGDIKQSVYRFRHADPGLFAGYIELGELDKTGGAIHIPLTCSFRMNGAMMDAINSVFGSLWRDGVIEARGARSVRYEPLMPPRDAPWWEERNSGASRTAPCEIFLCRNDSDLSMGEKRKKLASGLAQKLRAIVDGGESIWDRAEKTFRPAKWSDIALLVPTRTPYLVIEEAFEEAGIPVVFGSGREYFNRGEVRDAVNLLRALDEPLDDYALAGWIESPFSGVKPLAALNLAILRCDGSPLLSSFSDHFPDETSRFMALRRRAHLAGPSSALLSLIEDQSWLAVYRAETRLRVMSNIRRAIEIARDYESSIGASLSGCADYLGRAMRGGEPVEEPDSSEQGGDFVQVKTVHASKGQEFPIVVLMGMESPVRSGTPRRASVSRRLGIVARKLPICSEPGDSDEIESVLAKWHSFIEEMEETDEKERLMYVAMTRAQERLICCAVHDGKASEKNDKNSWIEWLLRANDEGKFPVTFVEPEAPSDGGRWMTREKSAELERRPASPIPVEDDYPGLSLASLSATAYSLFIWCPAAYRMRYRQGRALRWNMSAGDGYGGADVGSLAHWVLSMWDFCPDSLGRFLPRGDIGEHDSFARGLPDFLRPIFASGRNRGVLRSWLAEFAETDECVKLRGVLEQGLLKRELPFSVPFGGVNLVGSIDVFWEDETGIHVRDWKITPAENAPDELYHEQVNFYALACRIAGLAGDGAPVEPGLFYLRPSSSPESLSKTWHVENWGLVESSVRRVAQEAASGPFEPTPGRCSGCPFKSYCPSGTSECL